MTERIIFLDIDGPIITDSMFELNENVSHNRTYMNANALGYVVTLAKVANAKIVTNSTHNYHIVYHDEWPPTDLKTDLIFHGVPEHLFHKDWRTRFAHSEDAERDPHLLTDRLSGIDEYLTERKLNLNDEGWICFDDDLFTRRRNLILVDSRCGITYADYVEASNFWDVDVVI